MRKLFHLFFLVFVSVRCTTVEKPGYQVIKKYESFEIRQYPPQLVAEVYVENEFQKAGNAGFRILADFIFGNNKKQKKIAMTAPVSQNLSEKINSESLRAKSETEISQKIAMTAPVAMEKKGNSYLIRFYLPIKYNLQTIPYPVDRRIMIRERPAVKMAAIRYSGTWIQTNYEFQKEILVKNLKKHQIKPKGNAIFARYNSPYTLWFLRRNEVLFELEE